MMNVYPVPISLFAPAVLISASSVASVLYPEYVDNTSADLERSRYSREDFSCCGKPPIQRNPPETFKIIVWWKNEKQNHLYNIDGLDCLCSCKWCRSRCKYKGIRFHGLYIFINNSCAWWVLNDSSGGGSCYRWRYDSCIKWCLYRICGNW